MEGDNVLAAIGDAQDTTGVAGAGAGEDDPNGPRMQPAPLNFNMAELESFRYRVEDTARSVTNAAVKEFRTAEIKREILHSAKLKTHFMENPNDLKVRLIIYYDVMGYTMISYHVISCGMLSQL